MKKNLGLHFIIQFIIGFGFLGGVFTKVGFRPETILVEGFSKVIDLLIQNDLIFNYDYSPFFIIVGPLMAFISIVLAFKSGGVLGIVGVVFAFLSGILLGTQIFPYLFGMAIFLGLIAPYI
jgi:hypothetical protein